MSLDLSFNDSSNSQISDLQWTFTYPSANITAVNVAASQSITNAGKSITCNGGTGTYTCLLGGMNKNVTPNGVIASVQFTLSASASTTNIAITNALGSSATGYPVAVTTGSGSISAVAPPTVTLASLACSPTSLASNATSTCTVAISSAAPSGGTAVTVSDNNSTLSTPTFVTVAAGTTSATFTATAGTVTSNQTATVTATLNGSSKSAALSLLAPITLTSLVCSPTSLAPNSSSTCTLTLSQPAPSSGSTVGISATSTAITLPASVTVPASSSSATFTATAATDASAQTVVLTATLPGASVTTSMAITSGSVTLSVGPGQTYTKPCQALAAAPDGALIQIDPSGSYQGDVCAITANNLTISGLNGRARIDAAGQNALGQGTWVIQGSNTTVENIEFTGATDANHNGAAIHQQGPGLTVRNCYFHNNQEGILADSSSTGEILIEYSEFAYNGYGDGNTHNISIGTVPRFTLRYSYSHHAVAGDLVKSRAAQNYILYNRLSSEAGASTSYKLDLPNGGESFVMGNVIEQGPNDTNSALFSYLEEGPAAGIPSSDLFVVNNTFVNDGPSGTFISIGPTDVTPAVIKNNIFSGPGSITTQSTAIQAANSTSAPLFVNPSSYDYHLNAGSPAIDSGVAAGTGDGISLAPDSEYVNPACGEARDVAGSAIDIGAYEFGGAGALLSCGPRPTALAALTLNPATVSGGSATTANSVTLTAAAPSGGAVVSLASSNPGAASVPASITVPAGATSAAFTIQTSAVAAATSVTISASYAGSVQTASLTVSGMPAALASLQCSPTSLTPGSSSTCTVTLSGTAPGGGTAIALASNNTALSVPASVTVPSGSSVGTFSANAGNVSSAQSATITATLGSTAKTFPISLAPASVSLAGLTCSQRYTWRGLSGTCTVTLSGPASGSGFVVTLKSSTMSLSVPGSVTVAPGSSAATFGFTTSRFVRATITASAGTVSKSVSIR